MLELKPCPFCGSRAKVYAGEEGLAVICVNCDAKTHYFKDEFKTNGDRLIWSAEREALSKAVYSWNTRETDTRKFMKGFNVWREAE